jgi:hypothetical protein
VKDAYCCAKKRNTLQPLEVFVRVTRQHQYTILLALTLCLASSSFSTAAEPALSKDQIKKFLLNGKVVSSKQTSKGVTQPWRLTLTDGSLTHDAQFQSIDQRKTSMQFATGNTEINFVDSYKYNIAAYALAELLGVDDMLPVYVERKWKGQVGSISWWLPVKMDEEDRLKRKISAPDTDAWNKKMYKIRVFNELVYDTDANLTNVLIGEDWTAWRVDFSRAFRLFKDLRNANNLVRCERQLFERLKALDEAELTRNTKNYLTKPEVQAVMARRDRIIAYFQKLAAEKGENEIFY